MDGLIILAAFAVLIAPLIISITAIVKFANLRDEISSLGRRLRRLQPEAATPKPVQQVPKSEPAQSTARCSGVTGRLCCAAWASCP